MRGPAARARNAGACSWSLQCEECGTQGWNGQMLRDYYGRGPPSFFDCCNAATSRVPMYTSVARLGIDSAARAGRKLLASVFRRFTEGFDTPDFVTPNALLTSHCGSARCWRPQDRGDCPNRKDPIIDVLPCDDIRS